MVKLMRTGGHTSAAPGTAMIPVLQCGQQIQTFWIVAPKTAQRTSLEKDRGTNAGTVMNGKTLNVKNEAEYLLTFLIHDPFASLAPS